MHARVLKVEENRLLVEAYNDEIYYDQLYLLLSNNTCSNVDDIQINDEIEIMIDDQIMMSLPAQVNVLEIK